MSRPHDEMYKSVIREDEHYTDRITTRIWKEVPSPKNPYITAQSFCHGYDTHELTENICLSDVIYLMFRGELPSPEQSQFFEALFISFINPGPRHPATRAAINAGVGKSNPAHILPISLSVLSGKHLGGEEVSLSMEFLRKNRNKDAKKLAIDILNIEKPPEKGDWHIVPGFGTRFNGVDVIPNEIAQLLCGMLASGDALKWGMQFVEVLAEYDMGWLTTGVVAAAMIDLGFHPRAGAGLYQLMSAPGLLAHGLEYANKTRESFPFPDQEHYFIDNE